MPAHMAHWMAQALDIASLLEACASLSIQDFVQFLAQRSLRHQKQTEKEKNCKHVIVPSDIKKGKLQQERKRNHPCSVP